MNRLDGTPELTLGWDIVDWIEAYLCHGPGDVQGDPLELDDEFVRHILWAYELREDGKRMVRRSFLSRAKGRAKSELAGALCVVEALGPVRFDGFDADGQPVGRPIVAPFVRALATEEGQSGNTYDNVLVMLEHLAEVAGDEFPGIDAGLTRTFLEGGGQIVPSTASNASKDGGKETFAVFDETHLYLLPELKRMHATVRRNLGKRKAAEPWSLETSTMYQPGAGSVAEDTHEYARAIADGRIKDTSLLFDHRQGPEDFEWSDDEQLRSALAESYGPAAAWMDLDRLIAEIRDPQSEEADSRRYWLNQVVLRTEQAFDPELWKELVADAGFRPPDKDLITIGFDGAKFHDATGLIGTHVETGYQWVLGVWEKPTDIKDDEWEVPEDEVHDVVEMAFDMWEVWRLYADPPYWESAVNEWAGKFGEKRVIEWFTHRTRQMAGALRPYKAAMRSKDLSHDGSSDFARHIANARRRDTKMRDETGKPLWLIQKEHPHSPNKIDLAMAGCLSWEARGDAIAAGAKAPPKKSVYEDQGLEVL